MISDWGEVVTRYPYGNVRMDHLLSKEQYFLYLLIMFLHYLMDIGNYIVNQIIQFNSNFLIELAVNQYLKTKG